MIISTSIDHGITGSSVVFRCCCLVLVVAVVHAATIALWYACKQQAVVWGLLLV